MPVPEPRRIRSFVLRQGRMTHGQNRALEELLPRYAPPPGPIDTTALFGRDAPLTLEIGFGDGHTLIESARSHPERNFLGVEVHRPGVGRLLLTLDVEQIGNVRVACEDAVAVLKERLPDSSLDAVLIYFPDPWPKKRHHKRRLLQAEFAALLARKLKPGGRLHLATDWQDYAVHMLAVLDAAPEFQNGAADSGFVPRPEERPVSRFDRRGLKLGHAVYDLLYHRR
jgi:tRNA (guanine-N7-)-methyltransferase